MNVALLQHCYPSGLIIGAFTAGPEVPSSLLIRGAGRLTFTPPIADRLRQQLELELMTARLPSSASSPAISLVITTVDQDSFMGVWTIIGMASVDGGQSVRVERRHAFETSLLGDLAYQQSCEAIVPACTTFLRLALTDPQVVLAAKGTSAPPEMIPVNASVPRVNEVP